MRGIFRVCAVAAFLFLLSASAFALSDSDYKKLMKDSDFSDADQSLNQAWAEAKNLLSDGEFKALLKEQKAWISKGRDEEAKIHMKNGMDKAGAYTQSTMDRILYINDLISKSFLMQNPDGAQGIYVKNDGGNSYTLEVYWHDKDSTEHEIVLTAVSKDKKGKVLNAQFTGKGDLDGDVLEISEDGSASGSFAGTIITFKKGTAVIKMTKEFVKENSGALNGAYVRKTVKKKS